MSNKDSSEITKTGESLKITLTSDDLIEKLRSALRRDGDFPASAKIVSELRQLTTDPKTTANQITEVILREPSLGTRVLHLVNSSFYHRAKPIMTVSQAVIQIGMKPLAELCSGLVLLQKFVPAARRGGAFANCLRKTVLTSLLSSSISSEVATEGGASKNDEFGYLAGSFYEIGTLLLAYYFPQIYEAAVRRADAKGVEIAQAIREITGLSPVDLSLEVIDALGLPDFYKEILKATEIVEQPAQKSETTGGNMSRLAQAVCAANGLSEVVADNRSREDLEKVVGELTARLHLDHKSLGRVLGELPTIFRNHCSSIDLQLPALPEFVTEYATPESQSGSEDRSSDNQDESERKFQEFITEIKQAVENREPTASIITSVMETLAWALGYERVLLMLVASNRTRLVGRLMLGNLDNFDPKKFVRPLGADADTSAPDNLAFRESRPVHGQGKGLIDGSTDFAVIPIGRGSKAIGIVYADRVALDQRVGDKELLRDKDRSCVGTLFELLDASITSHSK